VRVACVPGRDAAAPTAFDSIIGAAGVLPEAWELTGWEGDWAFPIGPEKEAGTGQARAGADTKAR